MRHVCIIIFFAAVSMLCAQDFFDSLAEKSTGNSMPYDLNGFMRGTFFVGKGVENEESVLKSGYGELGLKMRVRKESWGDGYAEVRFRRGYEFDQSVSEVNVREVYINTYIGKFDIRMGQQIVVWGRADAFNPTNNITPQNMLARSPDEDDRKMANFLIRASYNLTPLRFEAIWVPQYRPSVLPTKLFPLPDFVTLGEEENPDAELKNGSFAGKINFELNIFDGSLSYFRGFMPLPGVALSSFDIIEGGGFQVLVANKPYQMSIIGCDFSTTIGSFGLRGECAYRQPVDDYRNPANIYVPKPDFQYVLGLDKTMKDFSIIVQYIGRYISDFEEFVETGLPSDQLVITNRMIAYQLDEMNHAFFMRPALALFHETTNVELLAYYNITTEESLFRPLLAYNVTDALTLKCGGEFYSGPDNTLFGNIDRALSSGFVELKVSF